MSFQLYTMPNCEKCVDVKRYLSEEGISYTECSLTERENKRVIGGLMKTKKDYLKYDSGMPIIPIFVRTGESGIEALAQDLEGVKELVSSV